MGMFDTYTYDIIFPKTGRCTTIVGGDNFRKVCMAHGLNEDEVDILHMEKMFSSPEPSFRGLGWDVFARFDYYGEDW